MQAVTTIGLDIAKSVFQIHGVDAEGNVIIRPGRWTSPGSDKHQNGVRLAHLVTRAGGAGLTDRTGRGGVGTNGGLAGRAPRGGRGIPRFSAVESHRSTAPSASRMCPSAHQPT
jgi:hypothetical protein